MRSRFLLTGALLFSFAAGNPAAAQLPDLTGRISSLSLQHHKDVPTADYAEGCSGGLLDRSLLRFSLTTTNVGTADLILGDPGCPDCLEHPSVICGNPRYMCSGADGHNHAHLIGFANYTIRRLDTGEVMAEGHKEGFCLQDSNCTPPAVEQFNCNFQGISVGCSDTYGASLGCQYVDVTGLPPGQYKLHAIVNYNGVITESDTSNNETEVLFNMTAPPLPDLEPVLSNVNVDTDPDCGSLGDATRVLRFSLFAQNSGAFAARAFHDGPLVSYTVRDAGSGVERLSKEFDPSCVSDQSCGGDATYTCGNQGLSPRCKSVISSGSTCDGLDISALQPGSYELVARIDPRGKIWEQDTGNNTAVVPFQVDNSPTPPPTHTPGTSGTPVPNPNGCDADVEFMLGATTGAPRAGGYMVRGKVPRRLGHPARHGLTVHFLINGREVSATTIKPSGSGKGCGKREGWRRLKRNKSWRFDAQSGFLDAACTVSSRGLRRVSVRKVRRGFRIIVKGATFLKDQNDPDALEVRLESGKRKQSC